MCRLTYAVVGLSSPVSRANFSHSFGISRADRGVASEGDLHLVEDGHYIAHEYSDTNAAVTSRNGRGKLCRYRNEEAKSPRTPCTNPLHKPNGKNCRCPDIFLALAAGRSRPQRVVYRRFVGRTDFGENIDPSHWQRRKHFNGIPNWSGNGTTGAGRPSSPRGRIVHTKFWPPGASVIRISS